MVKISIDLDWETYLKSKESGKDHREIYCKGLEVDYEPRKVGRPKAFDTEAYAERAREVYLQRLRDYNTAHQGEADEARRALGIDLKPGQSLPAAGFGKHKKRSEG